MVRAPTARWLLIASFAGCQGGSRPGSDNPTRWSYDGLIDPPGQAPAGAACTPAQAPALTRFARLTHRQYDNGVRDLTGLDLGLSRDFLPDNTQAGFDRGVDLQVGDTLGQSYRLAAEQLAAAVISAPDAYQRVVGCDPTLLSGDACARSFIASFGRKVFRRPLGAAEVASRLALFHQGATLVDSGDDFQRGVQVSLEAFFQSPYFLYRIELGRQADANGLVALDSYEIAARLSYALTNTTPDPILAAAADAGALGSPAAVAAQAARLMTSPAAHDTVRDFHHQWLDLDVYPQKLVKDPTLYPSVTPALAPVLTGEVEAFVDAVTFDRKKGLRSLLTAPFTYVNQATAPLYGVDGTFGQDLVRVDLDPTRRAGLLTQVGFLATRAFADLSSPIHRGVFIQRQLLCTLLPNPPANIPALPPVDGSTIKTTRQQVEAHTAPAACAGCHQAIINPPGFGLENYDAVGQFRTSENGVPIDATGQLVATAGLAPFSNGVELANAIAAAPESAHCYATNWLRYLLGRSETAADDCALAALTAELANDDYAGTDLLVDMTRTRAFMFRTLQGN